MSTREWDAASYHRLSGHQHEWGRRVLARLALRGEETVLDAGCGTGRLTFELAQRLPRGRLLAVDLSENMLRKAEQYFQECHPERGGGNAPPSRRTPVGSQSSTKVTPGARIHLICADLAALPFKQSLDGIFSTAAFHWVKDHDRLFRSLFTSLKPGGWLEAQCGGGPNLARLRRHAQVLMSREPYTRYFAGWQPPQFYADEASTAARLRNAGFVDVATSIEPAGFSLDNVPDYRQYLATVTFHQHIAQITDSELRERFLDDMVQQALADKELHLDYWRLNIRARKPA